MKFEHKIIIYNDAVLYRQEYEILIKVSARWGLPTERSVFNGVSPVGTRRRRNGFRLLILLSDKQ